MGVKSERYIHPLIAAVGEGQKVSTNHMIRKLPQVTFFRFDTELEDKKGRIDDGSRENLRYLKEKAEAMINSNINQLETIAQIIIREKTKEEPNKPFQDKI